MKKLFHRLVSYLLVFSLAGLPFTAHAGLIGTGEAVAQSEMQSERARVRDFLARADVQQQLQQHGVTAQAAQDRVAALTDIEVAHISGKIDALPAGAATGGAAVFGVTLLLVLITYVIVRMFYPQK